MCRTNASKDKTGNLTVAHGKGYDPKLLTTLLGDNVTLVPYKNSGAMLKGILGGDVDMMVNNQGKSFKYIKSGHGTCEASDVLPIMVATVIGTNIDVQKIRDIIFNITIDDFLQLWCRKVCHCSSNQVFLHLITHIFGLHLMQPKHGLVQKGILFHMRKV